jgi:protein-L-isoaspartate(D-aspartate) O-methyltransferase
MQPSLADSTNQQMVDRLIAEGALWSAPLIAAFRATPRHRFLDRVFQYQQRTGRWREVITRDPGPDELRLIYSDRALITRLGRAEAGLSDIPLSSSSQPSLMAQMLEDLRPGSGCRVLEIGAGTGYNAALLAHVAGPGRVCTIDVDRDILAEAWDHLRRFAERQVLLKQADGRLGYATEAPYDRIIVTAATPDLEPAWLQQLAEDGILLAPLTLSPALSYLVVGTVRAGVFHGRLTRAAYFMPLHSEGETGTENDSGEVLPDALQTIPAPWAGWFDRKHPRVYWHSFIQALTFYGLLRGLNVHHRGRDNGQTFFGLSSVDGAEVCWLGAQEWQVSGAAGRDLGWTLWRAFLEAGGPRPTEFTLTASPSGGLDFGRRGSYLRQGPHCQQRWGLAEMRERAAWL